MEKNKYMATMQSHNIMSSVNWECVVQPNQNWQRNEDQMLFESMRTTKIGYDAEIYLIPVATSKNSSPKGIQVKASTMCSTLWTRLPDPIFLNEEDDTTLWGEPPITPTRVGLGDRRYI